jgi:hypothetical protein
MKIKASIPLPGRLHSFKEGNEEVVVVAKDNAMNHPEKVVANSSAATSFFSRSRSSRGGAAVVTTALKSVVTPFTKHRSLLSLRKAAPSTSSQDETSPEKHDSEDNTAHLSPEQKRLLFAKKLKSLSQSLIGEAQAKALVAQHDVESDVPKPIHISPQKHPSESETSGQRQLMGAIANIRSVVEPLVEDIHSDKDLVPVIVTNTTIKTKSAMEKKISHYGNNIDTNIGHDKASMGTSFDESMALSTNFSQMSQSTRTDDSSDASQSTLLTNVTETAERVQNTTQFILSLWNNTVGPCTGGDTYNCNTDISFDDNSSRQLSLEQQESRRGRQRRHSRGRHKKSGIQNKVKSSNSSGTDAERRMEEDDQSHDSPDWNTTRQNHDREEVRQTSLTSSSQTSTRSSWSSVSSSGRHPIPTTTAFTPVAVRSSSTQTSLFVPQASSSRGDLYHGGDLLPPSSSTEPRWDSKSLESRPFDEPGEESSTISKGGSTPQ